MFKIGVFSKLTLVSVRMLRYYNEVGLLTPHYTDKHTKYRYYKAAQIPKLNMILSLRDLGFKTEEIREVLSIQDSNSQIELLQKKKQERLSILKEEHFRLTKLERLIDNYHKEEKNLKFEAVIKRVPKKNVVSLRTTINSYSEEGMLWGTLTQTLGKNQLFHNVIPEGYCYAIFFDESPVDGNINIEIGMEVSELLNDIEGIHYKELPEVKDALCVLVSGDYDPNIQEGFNFVASWLEDHNYEFDGAPRTQYIKGPADQSDPKNYLTEIQVPIKKRAQ